VRENPAGGRRRRSPVAAIPPVVASAGVPVADSTDGNGSDFVGTPAAEVLKCGAAAFWRKGGGGEAGRGARTADGRAAGARATDGPAGMDAARHDAPCQYEARQRDTTLTERNPRAPTTTAPKLMTKTYSAMSA